MFKHIGFDIDGVIQDYQNWCVARFFEICPYYKGRLDLTKYDAADWFPDVTEDEKTKLTQILETEFERYYMEAPIAYGIKELFQALREKKIGVDIVTARASGRHTNQADKTEENIIEKFRKEGIVYDRIFVGWEDKIACMKANGIELLVDDTPKQIPETSEYFPTIIVDNPYNKNVMGSNIYRIYNFYPKNFLDLLEYIENNRNYLGMPQNLQEKEAFPVRIMKDTIIINEESFGDPTKPMFIVPMSGHNGIGLINKYKAMETKCRLLDLNEIDKPIEEVSDPSLAEALKKHNPEKKDLFCGGNITSDIYEIRVKVIDATISNLGTDRRPVIVGGQIMSLPRNILEKYKDCPFQICGANNHQKKMVIENRFKKDYNVAILFEDIDEVSMDIRKLKIIKGVDPGHFKGYNVRQYLDSDGIDRVAFKPGEKAYQPENLTAAVNMDTFLLGDIHLNEDDTVKCARIQKSVNAVVGRNDHLVFLGDFDGKKQRSTRAIFRFLSGLACKNVYLIIGNNDGFLIDNYIETGFKAIDDHFILENGSQKIYLTHCPIPVSNGDINIHGHLHGARCYWNMDWHDHIDIWNEDFRPVRISECLDILNKGYYKAKTQIVNY